MIIKVELNVRVDEVKDSGKFMINKYLSVILLHTFCDLWDGIEFAGLARKRKLYFYGKIFTESIFNGLWVLKWRKRGIILGIKLNI